MVMSDIVAARRVGWKPLEGLMLSVMALSPPPLSLLAPIWSTRPLPLAPFRTAVPLKFVDGVYDAPGASEACNGLDDNCSGYSDDGGVCPCTVQYYGTAYDHPYMFCTSSAQWAAASTSCRWRAMTTSAVSSRTP